MDIKYFKLSELTPYERNPRKNDDAVQYVAESIKQFGWKVPIVIDKNNVIVAGHTRYKAAKQLGIEEVPCIVADDLTDEQIRAYRLADNKVSEKAEWDIDLLDLELADIEIDMEQFGFDIGEDDAENPYSQKVKTPQYQIKGETPTILQLTEEEKTNELVEEINASNVSEEEKQFLIKAAQRHIGFNYKLIAEYYASASEEMQGLMEKSALVIIDLNDAIANGYTKMMSKIKELEENDD